MGRSAEASEPAIEDLSRKESSGFTDISLDPWSVPAAFLVPGAKIAERYHLEKRIARGGMGSIWVALDTSLERRVAVKFLAAALIDDETLCHRFDREARAVAMLRTPHVATVFDHGVDHGQPFIVMELLEGEDLQRRLARVGRLDLSTTASIVTQVARALRHAHAAGIIHRDLKAENIFVARSVDDSSGELVKVLDFGVAKVLGGPKATAAGVVVGSPHAMSPEQMRGASDLDARSDVWALGVLVHEMLTGARPYEGTLTEIAFRIAKGRPRLATAIHPGLPPAVDAFFARALAVNRDERFDSALDLADALESIAASSLVVPAVRESLDTPRVDLAMRASRPSQRPTLLALEPLTDDFAASPGESLAPISPWRDATPGPSPAPPPSTWMPVVSGLCALFLVLLLIALAWSP